MKRKDKTKTFIIISNLTKIVAWFIHISALQGLHGLLSLDLNTYAIY